MRVLDGVMILKYYDILEYSSHILYVISLQYCGQVLYYNILAMLVAMYYICDILAMLVAMYYICDILAVW